MFLGFKIFHTLFFIVWFYIWWDQNGPANFLWFSDIAMILSVPALWMKSSRIASTMAVGVVFLESFWMLDFLVHGLTQQEFIGLAAYMYDPAEPLIVRIFSGFFHIEMPLLLLWMMHKWGYDPRAITYQTAICWAVLPITYGLTPSHRNINWVYGLGNESQNWTHPLLYLTLLMIAFPILAYLPSHTLYKKLFKTQKH